MKRKLVFIVTEDWYFWMHRLPQARAAQAAGYEVSVATRVTAHGERIMGEGFGLVALSWRRGNLNPFAALAAIGEIRDLCKRLRPDIVHNVALKAILLGTIAARLARVPAIVNGFTGLGLLFLGQTHKIKALRLVVFPMLRAALKSPSVFAIVENRDHLQILLDKRMLRPGQGIVIRGSGVDTKRFPRVEEPAGPIIAACAARLLRAKGIMVLAQAMRILQTKGSGLHLHLAGTRDAESPDSITEEEMTMIAAQTNITCLGHSDDMPGFWRQAHIGVLASLTGEGLPVSLLEAASTGRALVATDVAGCREIVVPGENGILVPPGDAEALAEALMRLETDREMRHAFGLQSRHLVQTELSAEQVGRQTIETYETILSRHAH
jgi:glycosyltransferase involved in cell wall biosynthesis